MPPKRCRTVCTVVLRQGKTRRGCSYGLYAPCRAAERQGQAGSSIGDRHIAGWCDDHASWRSIGCARRKAFAVETLRLFAAKATTARHRSRCAHAAVDPRRARAWVQAALAFECAPELRRLDRGNARLGRNAPAPAEEHNGGEDDQHPCHQRHADRPSTEIPGETAKRPAEAATDVEGGDIETDGGGSAGLGCHGDISGRNGLAYQAAARAHGESRDNQWQ